MAWDPTREAVLLFGGDTDQGPTADLDAWNGAAWTSLADGGPPARNDALLVADPERRVVVLHGGRTRERIFTDTWEWDGTAWAERDVDGPPARVHAAGAYDAGSKRVLVYGGVGEGDTALLDTWAWDGAAWTALDDIGIPNRAPNGMAWDPTLEQVIVLGVDLRAAVEPGLYASDLWAWTGSGWDRIGDGPPPFSPLQSLVEGPRRPLFVDGGAMQGSLRTWEWDGDDAWSEIARFDAGAGPVPRNGQAVAFDAARHEAILFGGFRDGATFGDTWRMTGGAWREVTP